MMNYFVFRKRTTPSMEATHTPYHAYDKNNRDYFLSEHLSLLERSSLVLGIKISNNMPEQERRA
jgi:hypothetical protein